MDTTQVLETTDTGILTPMFRHNALLMFFSHSIRHKRVAETVVIVKFELCNYLSFYVYSSGYVSMKLSFVLF